MLSVNTTNHSDPHARLPGLCTHMSHQVAHHAIPRAIGIESAIFSVLHRHYPVVNVDVSSDLLGQVSTVALVLIIVRVLASFLYKVGAGLR